MADTTTKAWAVETLRELVEIESPSGDDERIAALAARVAELLAAGGAEAQILEGGHLVGQLPAAADDGPAVLLLGHLDTVWPVGTLEQRPFTVRDGRATGPGAFDMKAGLVAMLHALQLLAGSGRQPAHALRIVLTADEEIGSPAGTDVLAARLDGVGAVLALEPPLPRGVLKIGRRGVARIALKVTGREAHAGLDRALGISATAELIDQLHAALTRLPADDQRSVNVGTLSGGTRANVVAGGAEAELGLRFADAASEREVFDVFRALKPMREGARLTVETLSHRPAWEPTASLALGMHVQQIAARLGEEITSAVSPGAGDANLPGSRGIATVDGLGPRGHGAHASDETVEVDSILHRGALLAELLAHRIPTAAAPAFSQL